MHKGGNRSLTVAARKSPPIITLTSDFGTDDYYVCAVKAVLLRRCPQAQLVDITHNLAPQDIIGGSYALERAFASFGEGTVHLAVVDPGVGTGRRLLLGRVNGQTVVCPDNGLITWTYRRNPDVEFRELTWRPGQGPHPAEHSQTFDGRDIMAPAAAEIAAGIEVDSISGPISDPRLLDIELAKGAVGEVIHIDRFGTATTTIPASLALAAGVRGVRTASRDLGPLRRTYADVPKNAPLALIGSAELLEIAVNGGSAARDLGLHVRDPVTLVM